MPGSNAHLQGPAAINVLHYGSRLDPHPLLSAIFISTLTIKGCDCCWDPLARANIIFVVSTAALYAPTCWLLGYRA